MINSTAPSFYIGKIPIFGQRILAPMDGYTDFPFRSLAKKFGSAICISEFINGIDIERGHPHLKNKLLFCESQRPFAYQIFDDDVFRIINAAIKLRERNPDYIDINLGCSARNVTNRGAGAGLLKNPQKIGLIFEGLMKAIDIPVTAKIRLGWDDNSLNYLEVSHILQESGASMIAVHARTRKQEYSGEANWNAIGEIKRSIHIPVIGNGDLKSDEDIKSMVDLTSCDAVMIGRAAIGNPWIFQNDGSENILFSEHFEIIKAHLLSMTETYGEKVGVILFRKHLSKYLSGYLTSPSIRKEIFGFEKSDPLVQYIEQHFFSTFLIKGET
ncbi:MAG: tRNA-dihydrouridine synthase [Chloroflexi bacterium]|nr:tRNA-dihydrouridine synthase [Chloroflexota bacterium]